MFTKVEGKGDIIKKLNWNKPTIFIILLKQIIEKNQKNIIYIKFFIKFII